jgi:phosphoribosylformimino-5-aminoimidazole carboxamide ribotide isomerase
MRVYFVMDLKDGVAVRGKRGEREKYYPVSQKSVAVSSSNPLEVVGQLKPRFLYVADLDRIEGRGDNLQLIDKLSGIVEELMADCGFRKREEIEGLPFKPVLGTETYPMDEIIDGVYVSLDFRGGRLLGGGRSGERGTAETPEKLGNILEILNSHRLEGVIVLSIDSVGSLKHDFRLTKKVLELSENPVIAAGGIASLKELEELKELGCSGALVATAIHEGLMNAELVKKGEI